VPYAITLRLDAKASGLVAAMWEALAAKGASDDSLRTLYPPHVTLAVLPDNADQARLSSTAREFAAKWRALPITLGSLGLFPGTPAVLFLAPVVTRELLAMHAGTLSSLTGEPIDPHYTADRWVPHVTLAKDLTTPELVPFGLPIDTILDKIEVVRFRPVEILTSHDLIAA
jgi:2'-5' RNA ligase